MNGLELLYRVLQFIKKNKNNTDITNSEYNKSLVELGLVEDGWDLYLTKDGEKLHNLLQGTYEKW